MDILNVPQGVFQLSRYPIHNKEILRAWDAADEYLLSYFHEEIEKNQKLKILIINDSFGALSIPLVAHDITVWTDSYLSLKGIQANLNINNLNAVKIISSIETPEGLFDVVLIKMTKSHSLLEDQLIRIKHGLSDNTKVISAGMAKFIHTSTLKYFEKYIGPTRTSLAKKKARLIFSQPDMTIPDMPSPYPNEYVLENTDYKIINYANVFSRESLDIGTRFFLQHIPQSDKYETIIDLACGNGVVGMIAAEKNTEAEISFFDESFMAVESARENFELAFGTDKKAIFKVNDCLSGVEENSTDLILNNPPFH